MTLSNNVFTTQMFNNAVKSFKLSTQLPEIMLQIDIVEKLWPSLKDISCNGPSTFIYIVERVAKDLVFSSFVYL